MKLKLIQLFNLPFKSLVKDQKILVSVVIQPLKSVRHWAKHCPPSWISSSQMRTRIHSPPSPPLPSIAQGHCVNSIEQWLWKGFRNTGTMPEAQEGKAFRRNSFVSPAQVILVWLIIGDTAGAHGQDNGYSTHTTPRDNFPAALGPTTLVANMLFKLIITLHVERRLRGKFFTSSLLRSFFGWSND